MECKMTSFQKRIFLLYSSQIGSPGGPLEESLLSTHRTKAEWLDDRIGEGVQQSLDLEFANFQGSALRNVGAVLLRSLELLTPCLWRRLRKTRTYGYTPTRGSYTIPFPTRSRGPDPSFYSSTHLHPSYSPCSLHLFISLSLSTTSPTRKPKEGRGSKGSPTFYQPTSSNPD